MLTLKGFFTGNLQLEGKPVPCFLEIGYTFEDKEWPVGLAIQKNTGDPILVNGINTDENGRKFLEFNVLSCGLKNDVKFTENQINFITSHESGHGFSGTLGFLRSCKESDFEFRVDDCCLDKFHKFVALRKRVTD
jgi:hypothetical protein